MNQNHGPHSALKVGLRGQPTFSVASGPACSLQREMNRDGVNAAAPAFEHHENGHDAALHVRTTRRSCRTGHAGPECAGAGSGGRNPSVFRCRRRRRSKRFGAGTPRARVRGTRPNDQQTTCRSRNRSQYFRITHPFHPQSGHEYILEYDFRIKGAWYVCYQNEMAAKVAIPIHWTSLVAPDPFCVVAAGRALFRAKELLELVDMVGELKRKRTRRKGASADRGA